MKLQFEQLGSLHAGEIELADLTIICGKNNTGKTYITNSLYALLFGWQQLLEWDLSETDLQKLDSEGFITIDLQKEIVENWDAILQKTMDKLAGNLHDFLATPSDRFKNTKFSLTMPISKAWIDNGFQYELNSGVGKLLISIKKNIKETQAEIAIVVETGSDLPPVHSLGRFIREKLLDIVLGNAFPEVFIASAERTGAAIFRGELNLAKNRLVSLLTEMDNNQKFNPLSLFKTMKRSYALSVEHNVEFISIEVPTLEQNGLGEVVRNNKRLLEIFQDVAGGTYKVTREGTIYFIPTGTAKPKLGLGEASSAVRSLMILWFWLNHKAKVGDMLMIDEPELNLHPLNQRKFARFLAALVNAGVKVFLTTHSDYIIRELNTLIMLSGDKPHFQKVRDKFAYDENDYLQANRVAIYSTVTKLLPVDGGKRKRNLGTLEKWDVKQHAGIQIKSFDDVINEMNQVQDAILYGIS